MTRPVAVAITGGIGAGKSEALAAFGEAARQRSRATRSFTSSCVATTSAIGRQAVRERGRRAGRPARPRRDRHGRVQRPRAARVARGASPSARRCRVPPVARAARASCLIPPQVCVTEVPLLYETGAEERFDKVVVITAPDDVRRARSEVAADEREQRLLPDDARRSARADYSYVEHRVGRRARRVRRVGHGRFDSMRRLTFVLARRGAGGRGRRAVRRRDEPALVRAAPLSAPLLRDRARRARVPRGSIPHCSRR